MLKYRVDSAGFFLLVVTLAPFMLPAEAAQAVGSFNVTVDFQSAAAQSSISVEPLVTSSAATVDGASQSTNNYVQVFSANNAQFAIGSVASDGGRLLGDLSVRGSLGVITDWHMVNILGNGDDPDRSYLEMLIGW
jgi:hypothetical protein